MAQHDRIQSNFNQHGRGPHAGEPPRVFSRPDGANGGILNAIFGDSGDSQDSRHDHASWLAQNESPQDRGRDLDMRRRNQRTDPAYDPDFGRVSSSSRIGPLIGAAAAGFVAGLVANMGRKAVVEATTAIQGDWFEALKAEHRLVEHMFQQILQTDDSQTMKRTMVLGRLSAALAKHDLEESSIIYPALRLHGRDAEGRHLAGDHADIKAYLFELDEMPKDDPNWIVRMRTFQELVLEHVREEEEQIYPGLRDLLTKAQNASLTLKIHREGIKLA